MIAPSCLVPSSDGTTADEIQPGAEVTVWVDDDAVFATVLARSSHRYAGSVPLVVAVEDGAFVVDGRCPILTTDGWVTAGVLTGDHELVDGRGGDPMPVTGCPVPSESGDPSRLMFTVDAPGAEGIVTSCGAILGAQSSCGATLGAIACAKATPTVPE